MRNRVLCVVMVCFLICLSALGVGASANAANIIKGDTAQNIKLVQTSLKKWGFYTYVVDGIWGVKTALAIKAFQQYKGLKIDGIVGAATEKALGLTLSGGSSGSVTTNSADLNLLARCVYGEARGEPYTGQVAVAAVVLNRVDSSKFPSSVSGVIYQSGAFTAVADGQMNLTPNETAYKAARDALNGWDPTNGCLYYYNPATATSKWIWSLTVTLKIGKHSFARG